VDTHRLRQRIAPIRDCLATLVAVPLAVLFLGSHWEFERRALEPSGAQLVEAAAEGGASRSSEVELRFLAEGSPLYGGIPLRGRRLELTLPEPLDAFSLTLQAEPNHSFRVSASSDAGSLPPLWVAPPLPGSGAVSRRSSLLRLESAVRTLHVTPLEGDGRFITAGLRIQRPPLRVPHWILVPILWLGWLLARLAGRARRLAGFSERVLAIWKSSDLGVGALLVFVVCFDVPAIVALSALLFLGILAALRLVKRCPGRSALLVGTALALSHLVPAALERLVLSRIAQTHELTVDHRMRPNPSLGINSDGARSPFEATDFGEQDFVILFLGDSYTYGLRLGYEATYPARVEQFLSEQDCRARVRTVNFGWTSSSPLLGLRLLREVGHRYQPDLIVYSLDMTDFRDDLFYEDRLRAGGDLAFDPSRIVDRFVATRMPWLDLDLRMPSAFAALLRQPDEALEQPPDDRYFVTNQPLERSREAIERGVMKNLRGMHEFSTGRLDAPLVLVIYPRAFQYSAREVPENWEGDEYEVLGPYAKEPFRYFEEVGDELPYPVIDLLPDFERTRVFPLFRNDDPHWNRRGAAFVARIVAGSLVSEGLVPCDEPI
jgi:hypothetical protein